MEKLNGKVLIADDDSDVRKLMAKVLSDMGLDIAGEARDGVETVDLYKKLRPDLLLLDINMPEKNGETVLKEIMAEFPDALVIMLTAVDYMDSVEDCLCHGAANYIKKGAPRKEVVKSIRKSYTEYRKWKSNP